MEICNISLCLKSSYLWQVLTRIHLYFWMLCIVPTKNWFEWLVECFRIGCLFLSSEIRCLCIILWCRCSYLCIFVGKTLLIQGYGFLNSYAWLARYISVMIPNGVRNQHNSWFPCLARSPGGVHRCPSSSISLDLPLSRTSKKSITFHTSRRPRVQRAPDRRKQTPSWGVAMAHRLPKTTLPPARHLMEPNQCT
jgi:hypothetical protein